MQLNIRPYTPADFEACLACFKTNVPVAFTVEEEAFFCDFLRNRVEVSPQELPYYVITRGGEVIGCGGLGLNENNTVSLTWGLVRQDLHKKGYGKTLLHHRLCQSRELFPGKKLRLDTSQHAVGFFEKYGFRILAYKPDGYAPGLHRYDMEDSS